MALWEGLIASAPGMKEQVSSACKMNGGIVPSRPETFAENGPQARKDLLLSVAIHALKRFWQVLVATISALFAFIVDMVHGGEACKGRRRPQDATIDAKTHQSWLPNFRISVRVYPSEYASTHAE